MSSRIPSPSRSLGAPVTPRRLRTRSSRSVGSPAHSNASLKLSSVVDQFKDNNRESFALSPLGKSMLSDNTDIDMPRRKSWWRKVDHSRDVLEVLDNNHPQTTNNVMEEFDVEVLSQEKKNYTLDMPDSSDSESISSIVITQRKLFTQKENQPQKMFAQVIGTRETLSQQNKTNIADKTANVAPKNLFGQGPKRSKPVFPTALLTISPDKTMANKTKEMAAELKAPPRNLFGGRPGTKRKNMFADFIVSESEDDISEIQPKMFAFAQNKNPVRHSRSMSRGVREPSPTSSLTTDIEMDDWKMLPSSTMVEQQLEAALATSTPGKRTRLSKLSEALESRNTNSTADKSKVANKSAVSKNKSVNSPKSVQDEETNTSKKQERKSQTYTINKTKSLNKSKINTSKTRTSQNVAADPNESGERHKKNKSQEVHNESQTEQEGFENENQVVETNIAEHNELEMQDGNEDLKLNAIEEQNEALESRHEVNNEVINESQEIEKVEKQNEIVLQNKHEDSVRNKSKGSNRSLTSRNKSVTSSQLQNSNQIENEIYEKQENFQNKNNEGEHDEKNDERHEEIEEIEMQDENEHGKHNDSAVQEQEHSERKEIGEQNEELNESQEVVDEDNEESQELVNDEDECEQENLNESQEENNENEVNQELENNEDEHENLDESQKEENENEESQEEENDEYEYEQENLDESQEELNENEVSHELENDEDENEQENIDKSQEEDNDNEVSQELENGENENEQENIDKSQEEDNDNEVSQELENDEHEYEQDNLDEIQEEDNENEESQQLENDEDENGQQNLDESREEDNENEESQEVKNNDDEDQEQNEMSLHYESDEVEEENEELEVSHEAHEEADDNQDTDEAQYESDIEIDQDEIIDNSEGNHDEDYDVQNIEDHGDQMEEQDENLNVSHDTTDRHGDKKDSAKTPETIVHDVLREMNSFSTKGRNTSVRKTKSILKNFTLRPSIAPPRESSVFSDGTKNSSSERSEWDSHRTTRKTLRQTFGKDFTPRKSLRTLVMEKSAKRQTIMEANAKLHQANSTELPAEEIEQQNIDTYEETNYEDNAPEMVESTHEVVVSPRTRQTTLEMYMQKIKQQNLERKMKLEEQLRNSFKSKPLKDILNFKVPAKPLRRPNGMSLKTPQSAPKAKRSKLNQMPMEYLPPEFVEDMKYKPPKRFRPTNASWITNRLYKFLETKLEPKYDYKARVRAEALVQKIYNFVVDTRRDRIAPSHMIADLKREMARLAVVKTHDDFYNFFHDYMPKEVNIKVIPDIINDIPLPREGVFTDITFH